MVRDMVFNSTFNNISVISWWSVLLVEETGKPSSNNKTLNARKGYNGMPLHVMEQPPRFFALAYRASDACIYQ
jgi:hypothetical protein